VRTQNCRGRNSRGEFTKFIRHYLKFIIGLVGERWKGLSEPGDLPGVDDLLGSFRWYDALCINQNDVKERNHQVQQMADIYRRASRVMSG
jgi:hypothetical protein